VRTGGDARWRNALVGENRAGREARRKSPELNSQGNSRRGGPLEREIDPVKTPGHPVRERLRIELNLRNGRSDSTQRGLSWSSTPAPAEGTTATIAADTQASELRLGGTLASGAVALAGRRIHRAAAAAPDHPFPFRKRLDRYAVPPGCQEIRAGGSGVSAMAFGSAPAPSFDQGLWDATLALRSARRLIREAFDSEGLATAGGGDAVAVRGEKEEYRPHKDCAESRGRLLQKPLRPGDRAVYAAGGW
jgi:hypothetical protein